MTAHILKLSVPADSEGERLDIFCARKVADRTRSYFTKLASSGHISVDGKQSKASLKVKRGMSVEIELISPPPIEAEPENIPINVVYEDKRIVVINKAAGMVVHPAAGNYEGTLVNALLHYFGDNKSEDIDPVRLGLVHRLDKDTSGLLVVAKDEQALAYLQKHLKERNIKRVYRVLTWGNIDPDKGTIDLPIGRSEKDRKIMRVNPRHGRDALTHYEVIERFKGCDLVSVRLETGRTHQIRVHLSYYGHPVVGDPAYNGRSKYLKRLGKNEITKLSPLLGILQRQALHASELTLPHPDDGREISFTCDLPDDIAGAISFLRNIK
ncbi:MAG: RluA family pseudouridine synthase [Candidatus Zixiibacteriota bacterium]|nr:MAG: RluA family pseudouridine synthase [candidate division Zixibacteria bacterium]